MYLVLVCVVTGQAENGVTEVIAGVADCCRNDLSPMESIGGSCGSCPIGME